LFGAGRDDGALATETHWVPFQLRLVGRTDVAVGVWVAMPPLWAWYEYFEYMPDECSQCYAATTDNGYKEKCNERGGGLKMRRKLYLLLFGR